MSNKITALEEAVATFIEGARIHYTARYIDDKKIAMRGLVRTEEGVNYIDLHSPNARDVLIPLLEDQDDGVRVTAASALFQSWPDLALPVIHDIADNCPTEAYLTASMIFVHKEVFGFYSQGIWQQPRYPRLAKPETAE